LQFLRRPRCTSKTVSLRHKDGRLCLPAHFPSLVACRYDCCRQICRSLAVLPSANRTGDSRSRRNREPLSEWRRRRVVRPELPRGRSFASAVGETLLSARVSRQATCSCSRRRSRGRAPEAPSALCGATTGGGDKRCARMVNQPITKPASAAVRGRSPATVERRSQRLPEDVPASPRTRTVVVSTGDHGGDLADTAPETVR
jgi:hypothetical protein